MARRRKKRKLTLISKLIIALIIWLIGFLGYNKYGDYRNHLQKLENEKLESLEKEKKNTYKTCLNSPYDEAELTDEIKSVMEELTNELSKKYNVAVKYEDLNSGFSFGYKEEEVFYGASLIKLVDAIYLYDKNVDLNKTLVYKSEDRRASSNGMDNYKVGESVPIKDVMKYAISVSDNTAHIMLYNFIGANNLKEYGKSLGAKAILSGGDAYGNQTANDTNIYLKEAYRIISENENGEYLKQIMVNDYKNYLILENESIVAHKYGSYDIYFHDIGIVYDENPYTISILTMHGNGDYQNIIKNIHAKINVIHQLFRKNRETNCYKKVYE